MSDNRPKEQKNCPQCGKPIQEPVPRKIIDRAWNPQLERDFVRERMIEFCSTVCGGNYQMGSEG